MANMTELTIERIDPGPDGVAGGVRLTATVPWSEMTKRTMDKMIERRVALPADDEEDDDVFVSGDLPVDHDALLIVGAIPAVVTAVARLRPHAMYGLMNGYAWELHEQRNRIARHNHRNRSEELWLDAKMKSIELLLRELRFAGLTADGALTRTELVKEERLIGGAKLASEQTRSHIS